MNFETIRIDRPTTHVFRIFLSRPETRNAQNPEMLYELDTAYQQAARDPDVKVIILAADGPHFSSGHDLNGRTDIEDLASVTLWGGFDAPGVEGRQAREEEMYLGLCMRWRDLPKPTIAQVHGKTLAGGLMLILCCDLIIASDDATFCDPTVAFGVNGVEYFSHAWDFGTRKAKELLFTGGILRADEAKELGMLNHVVPRDAIEEFTMEIAKRIALRPSFGLRLAKQAVNQSQDAQGFRTAMQSAMALHHMGHAHNQEMFDSIIDPSGIDIILKDNKPA